MYTYKNLLKKKVPDEYFELIRTTDPVQQQSVHFDT